ncbi:hypothetical protein B0H34DRAFT_249226 [Crassisporium funariophilum]|nr:hypothetical protein B0H34DRAFT_249226 [Crassisporium funariophilum]
MTPGVEWNLHSPTVAQWRAGAFTAPTRTGLFRLCLSLSESRLAREKENRGVHDFPGDCARSKGGLQITKITAFLNVLRILECLPGPSFKSRLRRYFQRSSCASKVHLEKIWSASIAIFAETKLRYETHSDYLALRRVGFSMNSQSSESLGSVGIRVSAAR